MVLEGFEATVTLTHKNIKVLSHHGIVKARKALGYASGVIANNIFFYNNSMSVLLRALTERLYYVKGVDGFVPCPRPQPNIFKTLIPFRRMLRKKLPCLPPVWTNEEFVQSYTGSKRKRYDAAVQSLNARGIKRSQGYWKTFIKAEFYNATNKNNPCPRLIQPRTPEYNVLVGKYLRPMEKLIYKSIDRVFGHHVVLKCDNPWARAATIVKYWSEFDDPVFVGLDASRFDQHVSAEALRFEHSVYRCINDDPQFAELLEWQIDNIGFANMSDGVVKYTQEGCRGSGDMNTALGNVVLMCGITHHYLKSLPCKWRFINDGDDCGLFIERRDMDHLRGLPAHHLQFGFEMEVEPPAYEIEHIEFCQSRPIHLGNDNWMMVRNIHKAMQNDWLSITSRDYATLGDVMVATGRCGLALYADLPILSEMYSAMLRFKSNTKIVERILTEDFSGLGRTWRMFASEHRKYPVDEICARVSIYKAFGILPDAQEDYEQSFRALIPSNLPKITHYTSPTSRLQYYLDG